MNVLPIKKCLAAAVVGVVFGVATAFGCSCVTIGESLNNQVANAYNQASVVFTGKVVALEYQKGISVENHDAFLKSRGQQPDYETQVVKFEIDSWWKTELPPIFFLATDETKSPDGTGSGSSCDYGFEIGKTYIVYAAGRGRETRNNACSRTGPLNRAQEDLNLLGPGKKPRDGYQ